MKDTAIFSHEDTLKPTTSFLLKLRLKIAVLFWLNYAVKYSVILPKKTPLNIPVIFFCESALKFIFFFLVTELRRKIYGNFLDGNAFKKSTIYLCVEKFREIVILD